MQNIDHLPLTEVPREIKRVTGKKPPTYNQLHRAVVDAAIPAERVNGVWVVLRSDLPAIAGEFGIEWVDPVEPTDDMSPTTRPRRTRVAA
jgi:hypothetical protein